MGNDDEYIAIDGRSKEAEGMKVEVSIGFSLRSKTGHLMQSAYTQMTIENKTTGVVCTGGLTAAHVPTLEIIAHALSMVVKDAKNSPKFKALESKVLKQKPEVLRGDDDE